MISGGVQLGADDKPSTVCALARFVDFDLILSSFLSSKKIRRKQFEEWNWPICLTDQRKTLIALINDFAVLREPDVRDANEPISKNGRVADKCVVSKRLCV